MSKGKTKRKQEGRSRENIGASIQAPLTNVKKERRWDRTDTMNAKVRAPCLTWEVTERDMGASGDHLVVLMM